MPRVAKSSIVYNSVRKFFKMFRTLFSIMMIKMSAKFKSFGFQNRVQLLKVETGGVHSVLRRTLLCSRTLGMLPLSGLTCPSSSKLRFSLKSIYSVYYFTSVFAQLSMLMLNVYWLIKTGTSFTSATSVLFLLSTSSSMMLLMRIGRSWPNFVRAVEEIESKLPPFKRNLTRICNITTGFTLFFAAVGYSLLKINEYSVARACNSENVVETYLHINMPWFFDLTSYSLWKAVLVQFFNFQALFMWTFNDLLIMIISIYLTEHLIVHKNLLRNCLQQENFSFYECRKHHLRIVQVVRLFNQQFGSFIVLCFGGNLYWICMTLYFSLRKTVAEPNSTIDCKFVNQSEYDTVNGWEHRTYYVYTYSFLVARTLMVFLLAAGVHSNSMDPLVTLFEVPSKKYNIEVERHIYQIVNIKVALSGLGFFYVSRTMILSIIGTVITYELVLLQYCTHV